MPEGHVIHRAAAAHGALLAGHRVAVTSPQGKFAEGAARVDGETCTGAVAHGKHLFYEFGTDSVHVHLGLRGFWLVHPGGVAVPAAKTGVRMRLAVAAGAIDLVAPATCEVIDEAQRARIVAALGPDPLIPGDENDEDDAVRRLRAYRGPVGAALLDQGVWAGLGNAFRSELLYLARVAPTTPVADLTEGQARALWRSARAQLTIGVQLGFIATVDGLTDAKWVYKQQSCRGCGAPVVAQQLAARTSYSCPVEQL